MKLIDGQKYYTPREIAEMGMIKPKFAKTVNGAYAYVIRLINTGRLTGVPRGTYRAYWLVSESEIRRYQRDLIRKPRPYRPSRKTPVANGK
jgi:hypothetical protein